MCTVCGVQTAIQPAKAMGNPDEQAHTNLRLLKNMQKKERELSNKENHESPLYFYLKFCLRSGTKPIANIYVVFVAFELP